MCVPTPRTRYVHGVHTYIYIFICPCACVLCATVLGRVLVFCLFLQIWNLNPTPRVKAILGTPNRWWNVPTPPPPPPPPRLVSALLVESPLIWRSFCSWLDFWGRMKKKKKEKKAETDGGCDGCALLGWYFLWAEPLLCKFVVRSVFVVVVVVVEKIHM